MDSEVQTLKAELYDLGKEVKLLTSFLSELGIKLGVKDLTLSNIMVAVTELKKPAE